MLSELSNPNGYDILIVKYLDDDISSEEKELLRNWILQSKENENYFRDYVSIWEASNIILQDKKNAQIKLEEFNQKQNRLRRRKLISWATSKVSIELNADLIDYDDFILPIVIDGTSKFSADTAKNVHYLYVSKPAMRFDRTGWTIVDFSSEEPSGEGANNGTAICVLDGNPATYWHSQWAGATGQLPHHFTIDMKKELLVTSVDLQRRPNQRDTQGGNFYISSDNVTFTYIGSFQMAEVNEPQTFKVTSTHGRYLKVEITESRRPPFANMSEVYVRGVE